MFKLNTRYKKLLADTFTPVNIYLKLRDKFPNSLLLESSDYHGNENSFSYICCKPLASIKVEDNIVTESLPDGTFNSTSIDSFNSLPFLIQRFSDKFEIDQLPFKFINNGLFGFMKYDSVEYFEDIKLSAEKNSEKSIYDVFYSIYQYVIVINHFNNELFLFEHSYNENSDDGINFIQNLINNKNISQFNFSLIGDEQTNFTDDEFLNLLSKCKEHCRRGDVFQIVLSREFSQKYNGDEFNVYRALRSINPSPYLFYFDYGNFKIFGSSPESQISIKNRMASIYPIAGTFKRTGDDKADEALAEKLKNDPKENAEHIMLVDLARNDLNKHCHDVKVESFREVQFYSHVIHLVSKVSGRINEDVSTLKIVTDSFPAGTLSGAPKYNAMKLIDKYENSKREFYGGCIGFMSFTGDFNHCIIIRSFLSKNNRLYYQAGAGVVASSEEKNELNEVNNKLLALKKALDLAQTI